MLGVYSSKEEAITERVEKGAAWLDQHKPEWYLKIDVAALNLADSCRCVLGQLWAEAELSSNWEESVDAGMYGFFSGFRYVTRVLGPDVPDECADLGWAEMHGFEACAVWVKGKPNPKFKHVSYRELDEAWIKVIKDRCNAGVAA
jgi:hypothetical protein